MSAVPGAPEVGKDVAGRRKSFAKHAGRKLLTNNNAATATTAGGTTTSAAAGALAATVAEESPREEASPGRARAKKITNMDDIDRILENDALDLLNMKKEVGETQEMEIRSSQARLNDIQKQHDTLHMANNLKQRQLDKILTSIRALEEVGVAKDETGVAARGVKQTLLTEHEEVTELLNAELRTVKMQQHMVKRLNEEIVDCKTQTATLQFNSDQVKHDLSSTENSLRLTRQEYLEQQKKLDQLQQTMRARKDERTEKMHMLASIVARGESSVRKAQRAELTTGNFSRYSQKSSQAHDSLSIPGINLPDCLAFLDDPENTLTANQVKELLERYLSRETRLQKIIAQEAELRDALQSSKLRKEEYSSSLLQTAERLTQLASNRQIYQEVDMKDAALSSARKQCEDCKEREQRLRGSIEALSRAFPRFLTKITKAVHPIPSPDQLPDAVHKLEDEISKLIKTIDTAMLKDATADDLALINQSAQSAGAGAGAGGGGGAGTTDSAGRSEIDRLQKLPGYRRLQRQLFFNLMSAKPDISDKNVRIRLPRGSGVVVSGSGGGRRTAGGSAGLSEYPALSFDADAAGFGVVETGTPSAGAAAVGSGVGAGAAAVAAAASAGAVGPGVTAHATTGHHLHERQHVALSESQAIDRSTIKYISNLIVEKDRVRVAKEQEKAKAKLLY